MLNFAYVNTALIMTSRVAASFALPDRTKIVYLYSIQLTKLNSFPWKSVSQQNGKFFLVKRGAGRGPEQREPNKAVLCPLIILILISYYYILVLNY
jgi:hypothetical protein